MSDYPKFVLTTKSGEKKEVRDHTEFFRKEYRDEEKRAAVLKTYRETILRGACGKRGAESIENIKQLARYDENGNCMEIVIQDGVML